MNASAEALRFDEDAMWVELSDGRVLGVPLAWFPCLLAATPAERAAVEISGGGQGLHGAALDEDIAIAGLLAGRPDRHGISPPATALRATIGRLQERRARTTLDGLASKELWDDGRR